MGFLKCTEDYRHEFYSIREPDRTFFSGQKSSLFDLLRESASNPRTSKTILYRKDRTALAVQISSSLLQLYATPWIAKEWSGKDIIFQRLNETPENETSVSVQRPYLRQRFPLSAVTANDTEAIMFRLGVLLLELCTGMPRENQSNPNNRLNETGQGGGIAEFATVYDWWKRDALREEGEGYAEAIRKCIVFDFPCETKTLLDEKFRKTVYNEVVQPLKDVLREFKV
jgi:hypothetical protein